jgi:YGGT family.
LNPSGGEPHVRRTRRRAPKSCPSSGASSPFIFVVLQALIVLRLVLLVLVANPGNDIVAFILSVADPFVEPFRGMFALDRVRADQGSVLDVAALVALIGWTLIEALVLAALRIFARRPSEI